MAPATPSRCRYPAIWSHLAGGGIWLAPRRRIFDLLASGALVPLLRDYSTPEFEIVALYPHGRHMTTKVRTFIDTLVDSFAGEPPTA